VILLYHNLVPSFAPNGYQHTSLTLQATVFERHIRWLSSNFHIVSLDEYLKNQTNMDNRKKKKLAVTFDDGTATTFACAFPIFQQLKIPATFFVTTCHLEDGELIPGSYLNAVLFEDIYLDILLNDQNFSLRTQSERRRARQLIGEMARNSGEPLLFVREMMRKYPLPADIQVFYQGMSYKQLQIAAQSDLIEIGSHTLNHPNLSDLPADKQKQEILESKRTLSGLTGKLVRYFSYPGGDYTRGTIDLVKSSGYTAAFATDPHRLGNDPLFEIERMGVYSDSLFKLWLKSVGIAGFMRRVGLRVG
jgi:peptidoglycan/xylan/chitin deacetylase (PgdA/CDA1 family)